MKKQYKNLKLLITTAIVGVAFGASSSEEPGPTQEVCARVPIITQPRQFPTCIDLCFPGKTVGIAYAIANTSLLQSMSAYCRRYPETTHVIVHGIYPLDSNDRVTILERIINQPWLPGVLEQLARDLFPELFAVGYTFDGYPPNLTSQVLAGYSQERDGVSISGGYLQTIEEVIQKMMSKRVVILDDGLEFTVWGLYTKDEELCIHFKLRRPVETQISEGTEGAGSLPTG